MKRRTLLFPVAFALAAALLAACAGPPQDTEVLDLSEPPGEGFTAIFNGKDFSGWDIGFDDPEDGSWRVDDGVMHCVGAPQVPYLITTDKSYQNFEFYVDFKITEGCNSGIFYHVPMAGRQSWIGFETQIIDDHGVEPHKGSTGAIYDVVPPLHNAMKPAGEWNQYRIRFEWPMCRLWLNGVLVQETSFEDYELLRYRLPHGPIGLSNHGHEVWYKNLWLKELPPTAGLEELFNGRDLIGWTSYGDADWHVENGEIVSTSGDGWLVTDKEYDRFWFHAYATSDTLQQREAAFYYRFSSPGNPGYAADLYDYPEAVKYTDQYGDDIPADVIRPMKSGLFLYRVISGDRQSIFYFNEHVVSDNRLLGKDPRGKIAVHRTDEDGVLRLKQILIRELTGPGI